MVDHVMYDRCIILLYSCRFTMGEIMLTPTQKTCCAFQYWMLN